MLFYLDTMIVQFCADYEDFLWSLISGTNIECPVKHHYIRDDLYDLRKLIYFEQQWNVEFAAPDHLLEELYGGRPTPNQRETYEILRKSWEGHSYPVLSDRELEGIERSFVPSDLKDPPDRRHLAIAIALDASWFLTTDKEILRKTGGMVRDVRVARPIQCLGEITRLGW